MVVVVVVAAAVKEPGVADDVAELAGDDARDHCSIQSCATFVVDGGVAFRASRFRPQCRCSGSGGQR